MQGPSHLERIIEQIASMSRQAITDKLLHFQADFPMDFTAEFLSGLPDEKLQHLLLAAYLHQGQKRRLGA